MAQNLHLSSKLLKHLDRLNEWNLKGYSPPIFVDFDITNVCNNNCPKCVSSIIAPNRDMTTAPFEKIKEIISQLSEVGAKAITYAGGGDPTCHPNLEEIIKFTREKSLDVAIFTNGLGLNASLSETITDYCTWARISLDASNPKEYEKTHGMKEKSFNRVLENIEYLVKIRNNKKSKTTIGIGYLIGPENSKGIYAGASLAKLLGADYIRFRPFFNWGKGINFSKEHAKRILFDLEKSKKLASNNFSVSYPEDRCSFEAMTYERKRTFDKCYMPHFLFSITPDLKIYPCCPFKNNKKYLIGDLKTHSFQEIWASENRRKVHELIDLRDCPNPCQFESNSELLWSIKEPILHENFL